MVAKTANTATADTVRSEQQSRKPKTKLAQLEAMLRRPNGATIEQISKSLAWQAHSVRGARIRRRRASRKTTMYGSLLSEERKRQSIQIQAYGLVLGSVFKTSFTTDSDTRRVRAIAAGFMPAWYEALIRLTLPAGTAVVESRSPFRPLEVLAPIGG